MLLAITAGIRMLRGRRKEIGRCNGPQIISILSKGVVYHDVPDKKRNSERVTTAARVRVVLQEEWDRVAVEEINALFHRLPTVMQRCIAVDGVITFFMAKLFCNFSWNRF